MKLNFRNSFSGAHLVHNFFHSVLNALLSIPSWFAGILVTRPCQASLLTHYDLSATGIVEDVTNQAVVYPGTAKAPGQESPPEEFKSGTSTSEVKELDRKSTESTQILAAHSQEIEAIFRKNAQRFQKQQEELYALQEEVQRKDALIRENVRAMRELRDRIHRFQERGPKKGMVDHGNKRAMSSQQEEMYFPLWQEWRNPGQFKEKELMTRNYSLKSMMVRSPTGKYRRGRKPRAHMDSVVDQYKGQQ